MFGNFGDIMGMMGKINSFKDKFSDLKNELDSEVFTTSSNDGKVKTEQYYSVDMNNEIN